MKKISALLLNCLNQMEGFMIVPTAVRSELAVFNQYRDNLVYEKEMLKTKLLKAFSLQYLYTVVMYFVGYHQDSYRGGECIWW